MSHTITIVTVCRYVLAMKTLSNRAVARSLNIHHRTWQRYLDGTSHPTRTVKNRIVKMMQVQSFEALVNDAFRHFGRGKGVVG